MIKRLVTLLLLFALTSPIMIAQQAGRPRRVTTRPPEPCNERDFVQAEDTHKTSLCQNGLWKDIVTGTAGGVTSFSAGDLSPLFTTIETNPTTTPALSFTLSNAGAHTFFGNNTGSTGAPAFVAIGTGDLPTGINAANIADGTVTSAEFQFINTLSSNAQTQLDGKQATGNYITALTGDGTASGPGSAALTLKNTGTAGTYRSVTFDAQGRETGGTNPTTFAGYALSDTSANLRAAITDENGSGVDIFDGSTGATFNTPVFTGLPTGSGVAAAGTASTLAARDANANITANNWLGGYATTVTAAGTTTLTVGSAYVQFFTGATTQTVTLPVTSTLTLGHQFVINNNSTGAVTVNSSGANAVVIIAAGGSAVLTCILTSGTTAASWSAGYSGTVVATGKKLTVSNSITIAGTDGSTINVGTGGTLGTAAFQNTGTSGANIPFLNGNNAWSGSNAFSSTITQTSNSATAFESGPNGGTNPVFRLVNSTASQADGVSITGLAAGNGVTFTGLSSGSNAGFTFTPKGTGNFTLTSGDMALGANRLTFTQGMFKSISTNVVGMRNNADSDYGTMRFQKVYISDVSDNVTMTLNLTTGSLATVSAGLLIWSSSTTQSNVSQVLSIGKVTDKILQFGDGAANSNGWFNFAGGQCFLQADQTNATTTFASINNCTINVISGRRYGFSAFFYLNDSVAADGAKVDFNGGSATSTNFRVHCTAFDSALNLSSQGTALATAYAATTFTGAGMFECHGTFEPSSTSTFIPRFAQNAHTTGTLTLARGSRLVVIDHGP